MENLSTLPEEIIEKIISYLDESALVACLSASTHIRALANQNKFWAFPCLKISLDVNDIPPKRSCSYFDLCSFAQEWFDAKRRAWKWRTGNIESIHVPDDYLCSYRHRIMTFNPKEKCVQISNISESGLSSFHKIKFSANFQLRYALIKGNMNSKYCCISTPEFVIVYKGYHALNFHLALGVIGDKVIDISNSFESYSLQEENNPFYFEPISNFGDILLIGLSKYTLELGPIYIVNLKTKNILRLSIAPGYKYEPVCEKYLPCFSVNDAIIFSMDGKEIFKKTGCCKFHFSEHYIAFFEDSQMHLYELTTKNIVRSVSVSTFPHFTMHFTLGYLYFFCEQNIILYALEIKSGLKLWETKLNRLPVSRNIKLRTKGGYVWFNSYEDNSLSSCSLTLNLIYGQYSEQNWSLGKFTGGLDIPVELLTGKLVDKPEYYDYMTPQLMKPNIAGTDEGIILHHYFVQ